MSDQQAAELLRAAVEEQVRGMSDDEFNQLVARTRPPDFAQYQDPADRQRAILASIAAKQSQRAPVDANGYRIQTKGQAPQ